MTFYLMGLVALSTKFYLIKKYFNYPLIAFCIYTLAFVNILDGNQLRAALAATIILYALSSTNRSLFNHLILSIIAGMFHYSGLLIIFFILRAPLFGLTLLIVFSLTYDWLILSVEYLAFAKIWLPNLMEQRNLTSSIFIIQVFIAIVCVFYWKRLSYLQQRGVFKCLRCSRLYYCICNNPILAHRLRELSVLGILGILFLEKKV